MEKSEKRFWRNEILKLCLVWVGGPILAILLLYLRVGVWHNIEHDVKYDSCLDTCTHKLHIVDANSCSYNPNNNTIEVWFQNTKDSTLAGAGRVIIPTDSQNFRIVGNKVFDSLILVEKDSGRYLFIGFVGR